MFEIEFVPVREVGEPRVVEKVTSNFVRLVDPDRTAKSQATPPDGYRIVARDGRIALRYRSALKKAWRQATLLPAQYVWFEPLLIATIVVFIIDLVGNAIGFGNRFLSALMSAIVLALVFGTLVYFGYGSASMSVTMRPSTTARTLDERAAARERSLFHVRQTITKS